MIRNPGGNVPVYALRDQEKMFRSLFRTENAWRAATRQFRVQPIEVLPGILSTDPRLLAFKHQFSLDATRLFPESVDEFGRVSGNGVRSNFYSIRHINGAPMLPATWPLVDNRLTRSSMKLTNDLSNPFDRVMLQGLIRCMFSDLEPAAVPVKKDSSSCGPYFYHKSEAKTRVIRGAWDKAAHAGGLILKGKDREAFDVYDIGGYYYVVYRAQSTDKITLERDGGKGPGRWVAKERMVADLEYAVSGGARGKRFPASKDPSVYPELGKIPEGFFLERRRTAMGGPLGSNAVLFPIAHAVRKRIYSTYGFSFHHTTRKQKEDKLHKFELAIAVDVSDHDISYFTEIFDVLADELLAMGFADWWVATLHQSLRLPIYVSAPAPDQGHTLLGDVGTPNLRVGLSSGNAFTDILGTLQMAWVYALIQLNATQSPWLQRIKTVDAAVQWWDRYLRGEDEIAQMSKSDDALLLFRGAQATAAGTALLAGLQKGEQYSPYMRVSYEHGGAFLGDLLLYDVSKQLGSMIMIGDIGSLVRNQFSPEYSVQSQQKDRSRVKRPYPGLAWLSVRQVYGSSPIYAEVLDLIEHHWFRAFGESYRGFRESMVRQDEKLLAAYLREVNMRRFVGADLTLIELEVLNDPSRLHWKYSTSDVRPEVLAFLTSSIDAEEVAPFFNSIIGA